MKITELNNKKIAILGFGIENIGFGNLRIFRVDCIWRSEFVNLNSSTPNFGLRLKISPDF